jgi:pSer/pThr/pTyr-binding forkhead associated (FHA) protein
MAKDPNERYGSCTGLIAAARTALARAHTPAPAAAGNPAPEDTPAPSPVRLRVTGGNAQGTEIEVADEFLIGRQAEGAGTLGDDIEISRRHARISRSAHGCVIEDLGSTNGTFVNGRKITGPEPLSVGDTVQVGDTTLVVQFEVTPPPTETPVETSPSAVAPAAPPVETSPSAVETPPPPTEASAPKASVPEASVPEASIPEASAPEPTSAPLDLRLEISAETGEARIHFDEDSEPVTLVYQDGRWRLAPPA